MLTKSLAYRIYWTGRYAERIEDICRTAILALSNGISLDTVAFAYGLSKGEDLFEYIQKTFNFMRENIRSFGDEKLLVNINELEFKINLSKSDLTSYFIGIENSILEVEKRLEEFLAENKGELRISSQEENQPEY